MSYSTRKRRIHADDGGVVVAIDITVGVRERRLTRDEHSKLTEIVASHVMQIIPGLPYIDVPLSKLKVTR
jgi:hypothetical protein